MIPLLICACFSIYASFKVKSTYQKYGKIMTRSGLTGRDTAQRLMRNGGVYDIQIGKVNGELTDHYHPTKAIVNLSDSTYDSSSVAAVAVAAHEIGHVMQKKDGYLFYKIRTAVVPVANIGSFLAMPLVMIGIILDFFVASTSGAEIGLYFAMLGVILYSLSFVFTLVTYPVELNASRRAKQMLVADGVLSADEMPGAEKVLSAAALTYLAALLTSLVQFLRFFFYVMSIFGGGRKRD